MFPMPGPQASVAPDHVGVCGSSLRRCVDLAARPARRVFHVLSSTWTKSERGVFLPDLEVSMYWRRVNAPQAPMTTGVMLSSTPRRRRQLPMDVRFYHGGMVYIA